MKICKTQLEEASGGACDLQNTQKRRDFFTRNVATACSSVFANVLLGLFHARSACQLCLYPVTKNDYRKLKISKTLLKGRGPGVDKRGHQIKRHWQHSKTSPRKQRHVWGLRITMREINDTQKTDQASHKLNIFFPIALLHPPTNH